MEVESRPPPADIDREARQAAPNRRTGAAGADLRARSSARSRSRGPSELLARRQQLAADPSWSPEPESSDGQDSTADFATGPAGSSSVEARLESLSELLKSHKTSETTRSGTQIQQQQQVQTSPTSTKSIDDVYILLAKKEKDLQLAAELGKVLLEKNDELSKANERITEDYSHKLELLEQDKHKLKRKLDQLDGEYENRLIELQTDCNILKNQLDELNASARQAEKEKSKLIDDLVQQNQRLTSELVEATKSEELLSSQLEQMSERFNVRMSNRQDHVAQLDTLKEEIQIVNQRKQDLERRLKLAQTDKQKLSAALDESGDKILLLENLLNEKDARLNELIDEVSELRDSSSWLFNELESMLSLNERLAQHSAAEGSDVAGGVGNNHSATTTTIGELEFASQRKRSQLVEQLKELRLKSRSRIKANEFRSINKDSQHQAGRTTLGGRRRMAPTTATSGHRLRRQQIRQRRNNGKSGRKMAATTEHSSLYDELSELGSSNRPSEMDGRVSSSQDEDDDDYDGYEVYDDGDDVDSVGGEDNQPSSGEILHWSEELALEIYLQLRRFHTTLQMRRDRFLAHSNYGSSSLSTVATVKNNADENSQSPVAVIASPTTAPQNGCAHQVAQHLYSPNSTDDSGISADDTVDRSDQTSQSRDPASWRRLLASLKSLIEEMPCSTCQLMIVERADYEQLQKAHSKLVDDMRKKDDELLALNSAKTEQEAKLVNLEERCAILSQDLSNCDRPKEEIVKLAWKARDEAVERKNAAEISLAKTRIENMQITSQLMEVVQQKGELSQKLAQFEDDIHYITQHSVKAKFTWEEYAEKLRRSKASQRESATNGMSNPLAQLLNFSIVAPTSSRNAVISNNSNQNGNNNSLITSPRVATSQQVKSSAMDNLLESQPSSLVRNFTSNRFNLRFWQRSSSGEKQQPTQTPVVTTALDKGASLPAV